MASFTDRHKNLCDVLKIHRRGANVSRSTVEDMGIDHRRFDVVMAQEFLDRSVTASLPQFVHYYIKKPRKATNIQQLTTAFFKAL